MTQALQSVVRECREDFERLTQCHKHRFNFSGRDLPDYLRCANCDAQMHVAHIYVYISGFVAAGGCAADIWPQYSNDPGIMKKGKRK